MDKNDVSNEIKTLLRDFLLTSSLTLNDFNVEHNEDENTKEVIINIKLNK